MASTKNHSLTNGATATVDENNKLVKYVLNGKVWTKGSGWQK